MTRYVIFGGKGMLAYAFRNHAYFVDHFAVDLPECDITDLKMVDKIVRDLKPEYLINCAAYTDVTKAEIEYEKAHAINCVGAENLAIIALKYGCKLIHFSTDFVYKGDEDIIYTEDMITNPVNNYGKSKQKGEEALPKILPDALIIRISWLYGPNGRNFASIISKMMLEKSDLNIVADQFGKTTYTYDVVEATANLINKKAKGIYHFANDGVSSRYEFTKFIYEIMKKKNDFNCNISPIKAIDYNDPTPRPTWSILGTEKYTEVTQAIIRDWKVALDEYILNYEI